MATNDPNQDVFTDEEKEIIKTGFKKEDSILSAWSDIKKVRPDTTFDQLLTQIHSDGYTSRKFTFEELYPIEKELSKKERIETLREWWAAGVPLYGIAYGFNTNYYEIVYTIIEWNLEEHTTRRLKPSDIGGGGRMFTKRSKINDIQAIYIDYLLNEKGLSREEVVEKLVEKFNIEISANYISKLIGKEKYEKLLKNVRASKKDAPVGWYW